MVFSANIFIIYFIFRPLKLLQAIPKFLRDYSINDMVEIALQVARQKITSCRVGLTNTIIFM